MHNCNLYACLLAMVDHFISGIPHLPCIFFSVSWEFTGTEVVAIYGNCIVVPQSCQDEKIWGLSNFWWPRKVEGRIMRVMQNDQKEKTQRTFYIQSIIQ